MRSPWLFIPPPLLFVASFIAGIALGRAAPLPLVPASAEPILRGVGIALIAIAAALAVSAVATFVYRRTTIIPHSDRARMLVATGPFRMTRNPMYLGLATAYLGATLLANIVWPIAILAFPLWVMNARVIPHEEAMLSRSFGDAYRAYQQRVRRWI